ncbi:MAG: endonuclease/exonuclease/phosphatase family protein [Oscillospiraceae bacterium]|nr:endonuclease/exonuclease/phosphatase family protein [Oscillospiraceae bacterium]
MNIQCDSIRILTFNILYDYGDDFPYSWQSRRELVFSLLRFHAPDVFCLQEPLKNQVDDLANKFPDYDIYSVGCKDDEHEGQHMSIFYLKRKFDMLSFGRFGLSEKPDEMGYIGWDAKNPRIAVWVKLFHKDTKQSLYIASTHLDHIGEMARQQGALLLINEMRKIANDMPVLICGDFNANTDSQTYKNMIDGGFVDCSASPGIIKSDLPYTYHKFLLDKGNDEIEKFKDDNRVMKVIDHIFYKGDVKVLRHGTLSDNYMGVYPSDHFPKVCDILLNADLNQ